MQCQDLAEQISWYQILDGHLGTARYPDSDLCSATGSQARISENLVLEFLPPLTWNTLQSFKVVPIRFALVTPFICAPASPYLVVEHCQIGPKAQKLQNKNQVLAPWGGQTASLSPAEVHVGIVQQLQVLLSIDFFLTSTWLWTDHNLCGVRVSPNKSSSHDQSLEKNY